MAEKNPIDALPPAAPKMPTTPHELHDAGPMSVARLARFLGRPTKSIANKVAAREIPVTQQLGGHARVEPLVAWAIRQGASSETAHEVARALAAGRSVDDVIAIVTNAKPPEKKVRRSGGRKPKTTAPAAT